MTTVPVWPAIRGTPSPKAEPLEWIFEDPHSRALLDEVEQVAPSEANVLITGETGTGKELIARHLHSRSARRNGPFVVVSCGAFSESLVDAELFGHENGAFAGAFGTQIGWFEKAHGGTIFLDEINDLPMPVQNKLLRVLQSREVMRLGGRQAIPVDLRILAATTVDLADMVQDKRFRKDLFYRLNVVNLHVLTLRERPADIVPLARYFIGLYSRRLGYPRLVLSADAERALTAAPWEGNVRELENVIHRAMLQADGDVLDAAKLRLSGRAPACAGVQASAPQVPARDLGTSTQVANPAQIASAPTPLQQAVRGLCEASVPDIHSVVQDTLFREVFHYCHYSQSEAARLLGVSRNIVRARLIALGEVATPRRNGQAAEDDFDPADDEQA